MGFYIKKGFNLGPVRINLSKSGIGFSVGTKGLRVGTGPNGNYIHGGRHGLYYRKSLGSKWGWIILLLALVVGGIFYLIQSGIITVNI